MFPFYQKIRPLFFLFGAKNFRPVRTRNYRGILSLTYRWGPADQQEQQQPKAARLRRQMLALVAGQKQAHIRERIQFLSDNFLNSSKHGKSH